MHVNVLQRAREDERRRNYMKKLFAILVSVYLAFAWQSPIYAQEEQEVWLSYTKQGTTLTLNLQTDGNVADGLSQIGYPAFVTFVKAEKSDGVAMSAVNADEKGTLKLNYLAEETIPKGIMYTLTLHIDEEHVDEMIAITLKSQIHNTDGKTLPSDDGVIEIPKADISDPTTPDSKPNTDQDEEDEGTPPKDDVNNPASKEETATGDVSNVAVTAICLGGATGAMMIAYKKKRG